MRRRPSAWRWVWGCPAFLHHTSHAFSNGQVDREDVRHSQNSEAVVKIGERERVPVLAYTSCVAVSNMRFESGRYLPERHELTKSARILNCSCSY